MVTQPWPLYLNPQLLRQCDSVQMLQHLGAALEAPTIFLFGGEWQQNHGALSAPGRLSGLRQDPGDDQWWVADRGERLEQLPTPCHAAAVR